MTVEQMVILELMPVTRDHLDQVYGLFQQSPTYFLKVEGCLPGRHTALDAIVGRPQRTLPSYRKEFILIKHQGDVVGGVELHIDHPEKGTAYLGMLVMREDMRNRGYGRVAYFQLEDYVREKFASERIRLGVSDENDVSGFWSKMGFKANGRNYSWIGERKASNVVEYEKSLV